MATVNSDLFISHASEDKECCAHYNGAGQLSPSRGTHLVAQAKSQPEGGQEIEVAKTIDNATRLTE
jgi:hypothetical protein